MLKTDVKQFLIESGHEYLFTEDNYKIAKFITSQHAKKDQLLRQFFKNAEGLKAKYIHDLIVLNKKKLTNEGNIRLAV